MNEPIRIRCEGSGTVRHVIGSADRSAVMCRMCGRYPGTDPLTGRFIEHDRDDTFAMIVRGDFG